MIGTCIFISGSLTNFASYPFAPASILAALEAIQFVTNVFFGYFVMEKHVTSKQSVPNALLLDASDRSALRVYSPYPTLAGSSGPA